jgi:uncharacterized phage-associated protein
MYSVLDVARYIICYCKKQGYSISNLKLQKILYFVQANFLVTNGIPCFSEAIEAWDFGPVVPEVYHAFKIFGSADIPGVICRGAETAIRRADRQIINEMVDECAEYSASSLVQITHNQDPWKNAYRKGYNNIISNSSIQSYFNED